MSEVKYIEASSRAKWVFATFLISILIFGLYYYFKYSSIVVPENAPIELLQSITAKYQSLARQATVVNLLLAIGLSPYFIRLGFQTLKYKEYPPPDTAVVFRTKVVTGKMALVSAAGCFVCGVLIWTGFAFGLFMEYLLNEFT